MQEPFLLASNHSHLPFQVDSLELNRNRWLHVMRDDLLPAGTKQRAVLPLLADLKRRRINHVAYASPFAGFAQVALAYGAKQSGLRCTLFCERDPAQPGMRPHAFTALAESWGAKIILVNTLEEGDQGAQLLEELGEAHQLPLGFSCSEFRNHFHKVVRDGLAYLQRRLGLIPANIWLPVGSGTLANAFRLAAPPQTILHCVDVHVLPKEDPRIQAVIELPNVKYYSAPQLFAERALSCPPIPSNLHYDAKLWAIVKDLSKNGDLWWNVAR